ncbi:uncharacterized protein LOC105228829 [Bactrocera dorsalis]|uniref:Uncharacterized protein LOC105228829 n=1 Tax=Bactrocera dorsalis TaxID=27457 RepID=A0A6I9VC60_BACDO|nr:uncharacterized protein LOC105228829 [Bactrocera dorsalis]
MSTAIVIFSTIIANICEPQICFEAQKYSYLSNGFNEIILDSCEENVQAIFTANSYCYQVPSSQDNSEHYQESICNMNSVEEIYNETESGEISEEKRKEDDGIFILVLILFLILIVAAPENESGRQRYRRVNKRTRYNKYRYM